MLVGNSFGIGNGLGSPSLPPLWGSSMQYSWEVTQGRGTHKLTYNSRLFILLLLFFAG